MHLLVISLLTILAGTLLLAKFRKDMPGKIFVFISWFFIVVGFILFIGFIGGGICKIAHHGFPGQHNCPCEIMMKDRGHGGFCGPQGMCPPKPGCMAHDSMMKCCSKHMGGDSIKVLVPKK